MQIHIKITIPDEVTLEHVGEMIRLILEGMGCNVENMSLEDKERAVHETISK